MKASGTCLDLMRKLLDAHQRSLGDATGFVADLGPGSFTGVKVGVTLAKTMAFLGQVPCAGVESFDLIHPKGAAAIPSKRTEFLVREDDGNLKVVSAPDLAPGIPGYGATYAEPTYPNLAHLAQLVTGLDWMEPELLVPRYVLEPSISTPKRPMEQRA